VSGLLGAKPKLSILATRHASLDERRVVD
jgi:hypothetical protein